MQYSGISITSDPVSVILSLAYRAENARNILFLSIFGSQFLSHQKISVTTKDTAEFNVIVKHVITTKWRSQIFARAGSCSNHRYHGYCATICFLPNLHVGGRAYRQR